MATFPKPHRVDERWRRLYYVLLVTFGLVGFCYIFHRVISIFDEGVSVRVEFNPKVGHLPGILLHIPGGDEVSGYVSVGPGWHGAQRAEEVNISEAKMTKLTLKREVEFWNDTLVMFDLTSVTAPMANISQVRWGRPPYIRIALLYKQMDGDAPYYRLRATPEPENLIEYISVTDGRVRELPPVFELQSGFVSHSMLAELHYNTTESGGAMIPYLNGDEECFDHKPHVSLTKHRDVSIMTDPFPWWALFSGHWQALQKWADYGHDRWTGNYQGQVPKIAHETGMHERHELFNDDYPAELGSLRCIAFILSMEHDTVETVTQRGIPVRLTSTISVLGGLLSVASAVFAVVFVRKHVLSEVVRTYDEVTFVGDPERHPEASLESLSCFSTPCHGEQADTDSDSGSSTAKAA